MAEQRAARGNTREPEQIRRRNIEHAQVETPQQHPLVALQSQVGNNAVARLIQRVTVGQAAKPVPKKTWEAMGGFSGKHMIDGDLSEDTAKAKWTERYAKDKKGWYNTVVSKTDLATAIGAGEVTGSYPAPRTQQRNPMVVKVKAYTVKGRTTADGKKVPGTVTELSQIGVTGSATESIYFPDHLEGTLST